MYEGESRLVRLLVSELGRVQECHPEHVSNICSHLTADGAAGGKKGGGGSVLSCIDKGKVRDLLYVVAATEEKPRDHV